MREIKFRAWTGTRMIENCGGISETPMGWLHFYDNRKHGSKAIMQFTGLLDKNGKEIYEGDMLRMEPNVEETCIGVVDFVDGCFDVRFDEEGTDTEPLRDLSPSEIIGNIYKNQELNQIKPDK